MYLFSFIFSKMTESLHQKLLNYRLNLIKTDSEKLLITYCISKIRSVTTIDIVLNFDQKDWLDFVDVRSYLEDLLEENSFPADWYFVPSYDVKTEKSVQ